ncbi:recombinase family protein [Acuticoccus kandeliae]|uniref:recombinase family protein n=1 Tax=Acuticoccus kandeliae TaxID=2073160 RepID=UPI000D3E205E|nr:recombinase family protein [Acuticoccus kandeliae]
MAKPEIKLKRRCAVYTRKSSEEGLEQEFNSLHAQREACEAYIASQRSEGWVLLRGQYDDGGFSGGTLERPGLKALIADIEDGLVDVVVVYKIDRLSRSLADFAKLVEVFDRNGVTFVSVTQSFNTTTSMGRLTLNILLSFAQFEREVTAERIRDKVAASKAKGMWMGGWAPLGYDVEDRKLVVIETEAATVRRIFRGFLELGSTTLLAKTLQAEGLTTKRGRPIDKGAIYKILNNRIYLGEIVHKGTAYPGQHRAIIDVEIWEKVHSILRESPRARAPRTRAQTPALLKGLLFGPDGSAFSPTHTTKGNKLYRYYVSQAILKRGPDACPIGRVPAGEIERTVIDQLRVIFRQPEIIVGTWREARKQDEDTTEAEVRAALHALDPLWDELFPAEQARLVQLLVERVEIGVDGLAIRLRVDGLSGVAHEMAARESLAA